jgi:hypothetical protein
VSSATIITQLRAQDARSRLYERVGTFAANAVRLQLHGLAYNLGNFMRTLAMPKAAEPWSLTSLREKLIKIGAKVVSHGRYVNLPDGRGCGAPADVPGNPVADRPAAGAAGTRMTGRRARIREITTAELRLEHGKPASSSAGKPSARSFCWQRPIAIEFRCRSASLRHKITPNEPGIRGMPVCMFGGGKRCEQR